jgi:phosphoserine phosphatase
MEEIVLINISGRDRPGLTHSLMDVLAGKDVTVLDMGQAVIHANLALGFMLRTPAEQSADIIKDLLFRAHELGLSINYEPVPEAEYDSWVQAQGKPRHIVTLLGRKITSGQIARISEVITAQGLNIDVITRLSGRVPVNQSQGPKLACMEFSLRGTPGDIDALRRDFLDVSATLGVDIAFQEDSVFRRTRRLVAFDMDSTLIRAEVIDELAKKARAGEQVALITEAAMRGELDFQESLRRRLSLLKGLPESVLAEVAEALPLTEGAEKLITNLKRFGYKIAIISGGFTYFGERLKQRLGIDYLHANELEIENGQLTGRVTGEIVDGPRKAELLRDIATREKLSLQQVIAVGDGANDLPMLSIAGLGIAFHAKPAVKEGARQAISTLGLDSILYLIGVRDRDISHDQG